VANVYLAIVLAPLAAAIAAGLFGKRIGRAGAHWVTIIGVAASFLLSLYVFKHMVFDGGEPSTARFTAGPRWAACTSRSAFSSIA
jgi:NADH-quinone oxidoreductase subunit L